MLPVKSNISDFKALFELVSLLADPAATQERLKELQVATDEAIALIDLAERAEADMKAARFEHKENMAAERRDHEKKLAASKTTADEALARRESDLKKREQRIAELERQAEAHGDAVARLRADLEGRLEHIRAAAA